MAYRGPAAAVLQPGRPTLDGGRLFFMFIELIIRRPIPQKFEKWVHAIGMILLLAFMAVISFKDIVSLIRG